MIDLFIIPSEKNNFHPRLLRKSAILAYIVIILLANVFLTRLSITPVEAAIQLTELLATHNQQRSIYGLPPLTINQQLNYSATAKAQAMLTADCWSHYCPDGQSPWDFFDQAGYVYQYAGENLGEGFKTTDAVISAWINSPTHRANILNDAFTEIGFGIVSGTFQGKEDNLIVVVHFGTPLTQTPQPVPAVGEPSPVAPVVETPVELPEEYIVIEQPQNDSTLNANNIFIEGIVNPVNSLVRIFINSSDNGTVQAEGENFTFRSSELPDGTYQIRADLLNKSGALLTRSAETLVHLNGQKPFIEDSKITTLYDPETNVYTINLSSSPDTVRVLLEDVPFTKNDLYWTISVNDYFVNKASSALTITLYDEFNNMNSTSINKVSLLQKALIYESNYGALTVRGASAQFSESQIRMLLSGGFMLYLFILLVIDFVILIKTDMLQAINRRTHLHIATLIILLLILNVGAVTGTVLTGIQS